MYNPQELLEEFENLEAGKPRLMGIKQAIEEADRAKDEDHSFIFRYEYVKESTFDGDHYDSILMFPELLAKFDANMQKKCCRISKTTTLFSLMNIFRSQLTLSA